MSIASELQILSGYVSALADDMDDIITALEDKGITATGHNFGDFASDIDSIQTGITAEALTVTENGTYTAPTGKAYTPVTVDVGTFHPEPVTPPASIIPSDLPQDGKMRIHYSIPSNATDRTVTILYYGNTSTTQTTIDWGDNTTPTVTTGGSSRYVTHVYANAGEYTASLSIDTGTIYFNTCIYGSRDTRSDSHSRQFITWIVVGENVTRLSDNFVQYCNNLVNIDLSSSSIDRIGRAAFQYCSSLTSIILPDTVTQTGWTATTNSQYMFSHNTSLVKATLSKNMPVVYNYMFQYCTKLKEIVFPENLTAIGTYCVAYCYSLEYVNIPDSVTSISTYAFQNCYSLKTVHLPNTITQLPNGLFTGCVKLKSVNIPATVISIGNSAFSSCYDIEQIDIPSGVTSIGTGAFGYCYTIKNINLPNGVTSIGASAFRECYSLESINIPSGVTSIGTYTFYGCYNLNNITIPSTVTTIAANAFNSLYACQKIRFERTTPPTVAASSAFTSLNTTCVISVPTGSLSAYTSATNYPNPNTYTYIEE